MPTAALKPLSASLPAGVIADRVSKKRILVIVLAANAVAAGTVSGLALAGAAPYWLLGLSALLIGASTAFFFPAYTALVPMLVDEDQLMAVHGLEGATRPVVGQALAPAVAGAVIGAASPPAGGLLIALTLAAGAVLAARLPDVGARLPDAAGGLRGGAGRPRPRRPGGLAGGRRNVGAPAVPARHGDRLGPRLPAAGPARVDVEPVDHRGRADALRRRHRGGHGDLGDRAPDPRAAGAGRGAGRGRAAALRGCRDAAKISHDTRWTLPTSGEEP
nr:MFS transporter [Micrococcus endophyticus]